MAATEGMKKTLPTMYWLPRLARWTGARLGSPTCAEPLA